MPFLAAGALTISAGVAKDRAFPSNGVSAVLGTVALVIAASATADTPVAPLVHAIGLLLLLAAGIAAVNTFNAASKAKKG